MTVKELIDKLQAYPSDMLVAINWDLAIEEKEIKVIREFPKGDPANPNCEYIDEVLCIGW